MKNFSDCGLWQTLSDLNPARHFELAQAGLTIRNQLFDGCLSLHYDASFDCFAPVRVWNADHSSFQNRRTRVKHALNFRRVDVEATYDNHVLLSLHDVRVAVLIHASYIARVEPAPAAFIRSERNRR